MLDRVAYGLGRLVGTLAPSRPAPVVRNTGLLMPYEGAGQGRRARAWWAPALGPNDALLAGVETLRQRARAGVRNDGFARTAIDRLVANIIGTGMSPQSKAPDEAFRTQVQQLFLDWTDESDADGVLDFYGQQALAVRSWLEGGEVFVRLRERLPSDGLTVPLQLQLLEAEQCPTAYNVRTATRRIRAGIEVNAIGQRIQYHLYRSLPAEGTDLDTTRLLPVEARGVIHLYDPLRPGQMRGAPSLTQALVRLYEIDQYDDATIVRQKVASLFAGFVERQSTDADVDVDPLSGEPVETDAEGHTIVGLEPGLLQELPPGQKITFNAPPDATGYGEFMRTALMSASVAADVPYEVLTGDLRAVNDRTVRVILNEFRRRIEQRQHHVVAFQFCRRVWLAWFDAAVAAGALTVPDAYFVDPLPYQRVEWVAAAWPYLNPVQDVQAYRESVRAGAMTLGEYVKEVRGRNLEEVLRERKAELDLLDSLGIVTDSDPRKTDRNGAPIPPPAPAAPPGPTALETALVEMAALAARPHEVHVTSPTHVDGAAVTVDARTNVDSRPTGRRVVKDVVRDPITNRITQVHETVEEGH